MTMLPLLMLAAPAAEARVQIPPVDECSADPEFALFRADLDAAIETRDAGRLLQLIDNEVLASFGGDTGHADFVRIWELDSPETSALWGELQEILRLGCATDGSVAMAPALANKLPGDLDVFETMVAVRPGSTLRAAPDPASAPVATLEWDVLQLGDWDGLTDWVPVSLPDGRSGFAQRSDLRSPIDYRATFEKVDGEWKMTILVAGD